MQEASTTNIQKDSSDLKVFEEKFYLEWNKNNTSKKLLKSFTSDETFKKITGISFSIELVPKLLFSSLNEQSEEKSVNKIRKIKNITIRTRRRDLGLQ